MSYLSNGEKVVMFVDDDLDMQQIIAMIPVVPDIIVTVVLGGLAALQMLEKLNYFVHAAVLDLSMSDMDGITLTRQIIKQQEMRGVALQDRIQIFWFTGYPVDDIILEAQHRYNVIDIFPKPASPQDVLDKVKRHLSER